MESQFAEIINKDPELFLITRSRVQNGLICYSESIFQKNTLINSLVWVYQNYFNKSVTVFLPKIKVSENNNYINCTLENLEQSVIQAGSVVIFGYPELIFDKLITNKRRLNTILKIILKKATIIILSSCSLKVLDISALDYGTTKNSFDYLELEKPFINYRTILDYVNYFDLQDQDQDIYQENIKSFIEMVSEFVKSGKRVYISLGLSHKKLLEIESNLKKDFSVLRKDSSSADIVINSFKSCSENFLIAKYDIYIFSPLLFENPIQVVGQFKNIFGNPNIEVYFDSSKIEILEHSLKEIVTTSYVQRPVIKDSQEFETYTDVIVHIGDKDTVLASEEYYRIDSTQEIKDFNLENLNKFNYDRIREYVKIYLLNKYDLQIKTCQLVCPSSPRDRSKKLNSLSNKISSYDYRCNCTCEIFKDYTIGIVLWNETFANRKALNLKLLKNCGYVYQTTYNKWKYTLIN